MSWKSHVWKKLPFLILPILLSVSVSSLSLIPGGNTVGIKAYTDGMVVTAVEAGSPAAAAGLRQGDVILSVDGAPADSPERLLERLESGRPLELTWRRGETTVRASVTPRLAEGQYRLGAAVRDSVAGIGTVTFYDPATGTYGALGHGISDPGGTSLLPVTGGLVIPSTVTGVQRGAGSAAGQLQGEFEADRTIGTICYNTEAGVFGAMEPPDWPEMEVAEPDVVRLGPATILTNVDGREVREYDVQILKKYEGSGRNLLLRVTDPSLLAATGGIVQGMSGSPILQDGKLVGAVTHVLVNAQDMGYGVYVKTMLEAENSAAELAA